VGVDSEIDGFLPSQNHFDNTGTIYADTVFDTLTKVGADGAIHPYLASSVSPNPSRTEWMVSIRRGVEFHNGSPLNADVVVANFDALKQGLLTSLALAPITGATKVDDYTVRYDCAEPLVPFPAYLTTQVGYVVARSQLDDPQGTQRPVGTGPFRFVSWEPNAQFVVERNPHYWRTGMPYLDRITFRPIVADASRQSSLQSGALDLMVSRDPGIIADLHQDPAFQQVTNLRDPSSMPDMDYIILNTAVDPLNDLTARRFRGRVDSLVGRDGRRSDDRYAAGALG
jgi:peptide/nickel transport system substrate-binding protein